MPHEPVAHPTTEAGSEAAARLAAIVETAVDGILTIDERGTIGTVNPAALRIFGYEAHELIGHNVRMLMPEPYRGQHDGYLANYRRTGERKIIGIGREVEGRRKDGSTFPLELAVSETWLGARRIFTGLVRDITERKRAEEHQRLLMAELDHRVRNTLAAVQSMARQTLGEGERVEAFLGRLAAFAQAHTLLAQGRWRGAGLKALVGAALEAHGGRVHPDGPDVLLRPKATQALGMVLHELATNAAKYGAWSVPEGRVAVRWRVRAGDPRRLVLEWAEEGGPAVRPPRCQGFGTRLVEWSLAHELEGTAALEFRPEGLRCAIELPLTAADLAEPSPDGAAEAASRQLPDVDTLVGRRILLVEDMLLAALELDKALRGAGIETVGPATRLQQALALAEQEGLDGAVLDINLDGEMVFPVAEVLRRRGVPFVFLTGYGSAAVVPGEFRGERRLIKPVRAEELRVALADALTRVPVRVPAGREGG